MAAPLQADEKDMADALNEARLEGQIWSAMALNRHLSPFGLDIEVDGTTATLKGEVESSVQKDLAEEIALGMEGIERDDSFCQPVCVLLFLVGVFRELALPATRRLLSC
ncbi:MAG: BON domain-containing protein [Wenzhouxiangella sp.]|nr:MAG: BON domain-containing protein [Wenzhouxiangella sp.]